MRFTPNSPAQQEAIAEILAGDQTGELTEALMRDHLAQDGWIHKTGGKYGSNNGYDNVFYNPETGEVLIDESKQWGPQLSGENIDSGLPKQMSDLWIDNVINEMAESMNPNASAIYEILVGVRDMGKLTKIITAVDKTSGEIVVTKLNPF